MLLEAVIVEINRRNQAAPKNEPATLVAAIGTSSQGQSVTGRNNKARGIDEIPEGKANLIRASFIAGVKPTAIARMFRISQSLVNRVLSSSSQKPKR
jgi:DNA invertase Pin-like site-specific DNA recombinase